MNIDEMYNKYLIMMYLGMFNALLTDYTSLIEGINKAKKAKGDNETVFGLINHNSVDYFVKKLSVFPYNTISHDKIYPVLPVEDDMKYAFSFEGINFYSGYNVNEGDCMILGFVRI